MRMVIGCPPANAYNTPPMHCDIRVFLTSGGMRGWWMVDEGYGGWWMRGMVDGG